MKCIVMLADIDEWAAMNEVYRFYPHGNGGIGPRPLIVLVHIAHNILGDDGLLDLGRAFINAEQACVAV